MQRLAALIDSIVHPRGKRGAHAQAEEARVKRTNLLVLQADSSADFCRQIRKPGRKRHKASLAYKRRRFAWPRAGMSPGLSPDLRNPGRVIVPASSPALSRFARSRHRQESSHVAKLDSASRLPAWTIDRDQIPEHGPRTSFRAGSKAARALPKRHQASRRGVSAVARAKQLSSKRRNPNKLSPAGAARRVRALAQIGDRSTDEHVS